MRRRAVFAVILSLSIVACGGDDSVSRIDSDTLAPTDVTNAPSTDPGTTSLVPDGAYSTEDFPAPTIDWSDCGSDLECGYVDVPIDYSDPNSEMTSIYVTRHLASNSDERIGTLLVNPGGPGFGGSILAERAENIFSSDLIDRFDILGFDPRGTGESQPAIDCIDDYDPYFAGGDITPDTQQEKDEIIDSTRSFTEECFARSGDILPYVGTNNVARDMDMIRRALGEEKISYFGFSYGSELGSVWATMFPHTVRAAVLDGATDPEADGIEGTLQQNKGFETSIETFLAGCSRDRSCAFHNDGDAEGAFDALMANLDENPIPTVAGRPDLTRGMALTAVAQAMYSSDYWDFLAQGLDAAQKDDGSALLELFDLYFQRRDDGTYGNELEAFLNILCADDPTRMTIEEADAQTPRFNENAPRFSPGTTGDYNCVFWPEALDPRIDITGIGAGPIVVIGTTGDAATPLEGTRNMARVLEDGRLIVVTAENHTGYTSDTCAQNLVDTYLIDLVAPDEETNC
ncbi:MAG: alpha/beta hydrolase [Ilumatobacteraceae bacterium]